MFPVKEGEAVLIVMYDASSKQEIDSAVEAAAEAALANGALDCAIAGTPERAGAVWSVRGRYPGRHESGFCGTGRV